MSNIIRNIIMKYCKVFIIIVAVSFLSLVFLKRTSHSSVNIPSNTVDRPLQGKESTWTHNNETGTYYAPDYGTLRFHIPSGWQSKLERSYKKRTLNIIFTPSSGNAFKLFISPLVNHHKIIDFQNQSYIKQEVQKLRNKRLSRSLEPHSDIKETRGKYSTCYYYSLIDKEPKSGEWECLTQGGIGAHYFILHFTLFTHLLDVKEIDEAIQMLTSVEYIEA